jgi:hypothetical protein
MLGARMQLERLGVAIELVHEERARPVSAP